MATLDDAIASQVRNIETSTGRSFDEWVAIARGSGLGSHGKIVAFLKVEHGLGHGNANLVTIEALRPADAPQGDALVDAMYAGPRASLGRSTTRSSTRSAGLALTWSWRRRRRT